MSLAAALEFPFFLQLILFKGGYSLVFTIEHGIPHEYVLH